MTLQEFREARREEFRQKAIRQLTNEQVKAIEIILTDKVQSFGLPVIVTNEFSIRVKQLSKGQLDKASKYRTRLALLKIIGRVKKLMLYKSHEHIKATVKI